MGNRAILCTNEKQEFCAYRDRFLLASQQNAANHFFLWDKPISQHCIGHRRSEDNKWEDLASADKS
jgi:hypothetical protein